MKKLHYLKALILIYFVMFNNQAYSAEKLYPPKKPIIDEITKEKIERKKIIIPKEKPKKTIIQKIQEDENLKSENLEKENLIFPEKKPIIYQQSKSKIARRSQILSSKDFSIAKQAFKAIGEKKWKKAIKISKKAKDKMLYKLVFWMYLKQDGNTASFYDYINFINLNKNYPRINRLKYLAEQKINLNSLSPKRIIEWYSQNEPISGYARIVLGESYIITGKKDLGVKLIKEGWTTARLSKKDLRYFRKKFKKYIKLEDNIKRAEWLAWENKYWDLKRMLRYLPKDYQALYNARQLLMSRSYGVDSAIKKVPKKFINNYGLQYDRLKWRRKRGRLESSLEILLKLPNNPDKLVRPEKWWVERSIISRSLIYKKKYTLAYKISSNHGLSKGPEYAEAEWISGWIALSFLNDPNLALGHFKNFYNNVGYPISLSRGSYWLGRTYEILNDKDNSEMWYKKASKFITTYYGQLAYTKIYPNEKFSLNQDLKVNKKYVEVFYKSSLVKSVILLSELNKSKYAKDIIKHLAKLNIEDGSEILAGKLSISIGRYDYAIQVAKQASYEKRFHNEINYPIINTPDIVNKKRMPPQELVLAVIRQESEFDDKANSYVGAKGMMQLMTYTARLVAKQAKLPYNKKKLTKDPSYNIKLGSYYLAGLLEEYEGSYPFALAAYNAGPKRVKYWKKTNGNPQKNQISYVDWIELIKFKETRNYVQRVLENVNVYKFMITKNPIKIHNFFEDKPHY